MEKQTAGAASNEGFLACESGKGYHIAAHLIRGDFRRR
jgi:hypothetical protein